jgi:hypothetical protein
VAMEEVLQTVVLRESDLVKAVAGDYPLVACVSDP